MKVMKDGTVKAEKGEVRIGNFFVKSEAEHFKIQDINAMFSHRIRKRSTAAGVWMENMLQLGEGGKESLRAYITVMWSVFSPAPDDDYMKDLVNAATETLKRHPDWYGLKKDATEKDDEEALKAVEEMKQFEEEVKEKLGDEDTSERKGE